VSALNKGTATEIEQENDSLLKQVDGLRETIKTLQQEYKFCNDELLILKEKELELQEKETDLFKKEKALEIREIRVLNEITRKEMAERSILDLKEVIGIVFKNPIIQKSVCETQSGQWNYNSSKNVNEFTPDGNKSSHITETTN